MTIRIKLTESTDAKNARIAAEILEDARAAAIAYKRANQAGV